ncbi:hypothetical protein SLEP1_g35071 [Rubroshorea leprosula]|uniref:Uncharacterized protein n=1 Tax=Rubroshorea leprosula TaxID=152421 RepID=A0AAV5KMD0_9ROSI|nr:hypothetical protein SLEP1_g35071 [Rubroshorea leprosula]
MLNNQGLRGGDNGGEKIGSGVDNLCHFPILLFFPLQPEISPKQAAGTSLEKPAGKAWFCLPFLVLELKREPRNLLPCWKIRICPALLCPSAGCSCFVGVICSGFGSVSFALQIPSAFPPLQLRF